jgi:tetratricopeptide (TPR) repeat protein
MTLGVALVSLRGFAAPEAEMAYGRALELCESMGENAGLFDVLYGLWSVYCIRADYKKALELTHKLLPIAQQTQDPTMLVMANNAVGFLKVFIGDYVGACFHLDEVLRFHTRDMLDSAFARFGIEPKTGSLSAAAGAYWARGLVRMSRERIREANDMRKTVKHPQSIATVMSWTASIHADFEEYEEAKQSAEECIAYSAEHGIFQNVGWATFTHGLAIAQLGEKEKGIAEMRTAMSMLDAMGAGLAQAWFFLGIAEQLGTIGDVDGGLEHVARSRAHAQQRGEAYRAGEADRIEAKLLLRRIQGSDLSNPSAEESLIVADVEQHLHRALETARSLSARSYELRAAIELAALRQRQGRPAEARAVLQPVVDQFRETPDIIPVKRAGDLLKSLGM